MGDVVSTHLDESRRELITARTGEVIGEFGRLYEQQYVVALFNKVRFDIEGGGAPQSQLLRRKVPLQDKSIFSGTLFQYLEENKKWRNRFLFIPDSYNVSFYDSKASFEKGHHPKGFISCAGYRVLTSMDEYLELLGNQLPGVKAKSSSSPYLKCPTQFPLILWHPYACHYYFCLVAEKDQQKWSAVFQDCVRHTNNGLSEECRVQTPAFTDAVRLYRQAHGQYGTWDMMCGTPPQILANLVMETLLPELRDLISPRLKGKLQERQRSWMLISDAVYKLVQSQAKAQYEAIVQSCEVGSPPIEASLRTDMDQIITSKEHVTSKIKGLVVPKAEKLLKVSIQPYITSILEALMEPTSRGFFEVRDIFFRELVDMNKNLLNQGSKDKLREHMEKISMLAFHPVKMQSCYEKVEHLSLEGLQQRFDVSSPSVFSQRAQILMREQMDDAVYTFEHLLHQSLEGQEGEDLTKVIQRCQDRVIKKFDYDSSTVRKRFFREALLQIFIPYMLKQLSPSCSPELPHFQELIFEDFSRFILVENIFEEVVLHTVMKDIMMAVKEVAVQRRHNLYRDSIVLTNSDPNLHLLSDNAPIDWASEYAKEEEREREQAGDGVDGSGGGGGAKQANAEENNKEDPEAYRRRRMKQVVSMIQVDGVGLPDSCLEIPGVEDIPEEVEEEEEESASASAPASPDVTAKKVPNGTSSPASSSSNNNNSSSSTDHNNSSPALVNGNDLKAEQAAISVVVEQKEQSGPPAPEEVSAPREEEVAAPQEEEVKELEVKAVAAETPAADLAVADAIQEIERAVLEESEESEAPSTKPEEVAAATTVTLEEPVVKEQEQKECSAAVAETPAAAAAPTAAISTSQEAQSTPPPPPPAEEAVASPCQQQGEAESSPESPAVSEQPAVAEEQPTAAGQTEDSGSLQPAPAPEVAAAVTTTTEADKEPAAPVQIEEEKQSDTIVVAAEDSGKGLNTDAVPANEM
ncbi:protein Niban 2b [Engraulis encrasicolus]|uniref:protein Niban 2b n=1 Tax=Engraulis encrasicolus TaxID=184585 RepID=UPI002FD09F56